MVIVQTIQLGEYVAAARRVDDAQTPVSYPFNRAQCTQVGNRNCRKIVSDVMQLLACVARRRVTISISSQILGAPVQLRETLLVTVLKSRLQTMD